MQTYDDRRLSQIRSIGAHPTFGVPLGKFRVTIRYARQTSYREWEGELSDATTRFTNPLLQDQFKELILKEIRHAKNVHGCKTVIDVAKEGSESTVIVNAPIQDSEKAPIDSAEKAFEMFDFSKVCRVVVLEEFFSHQKHLIVQMGRLRSIVDYASFNDKAQNTLLRGEKVDGVIDGMGISFAQKQYLLGFDEVYIHLFFPSDHARSEAIDSESLKNAGFLAKWVTVIPHTVDVEALIKAKDDEIRSNKDLVKRMLNVLNRKGIRLDAATIAVGGHETKTKDEDLVPSKFDLIDAFLVAVPTLLFGAVGLTFDPVGSLVGSMIGLFTAFGLISWRK